MSLKTVQKTNSCLNYLISLPEQERRKIINKLSDDEALLLLYTWKFWARPEQLPPEGKWLIWFIMTGRGWGKTRTGAEFIKMRVEQGFKRIALVGETKADVRDTMVELGDSALLNIYHPDNKPEYEPSKRRVVWKNGAVAVCYSGDEPDQLRGPQHDTAWVDELAKFKYPKDTMDNLEMGLRKSTDPKCIITTTPRPIKIVKELTKDLDTVLTTGHMEENLMNLSEIFIKRMRNKYKGTRLGRQELKGEILEDNPDALWNRDILDKYRVSKLPELLRIVVAVDPEAKDNPNSSETGIVVGGLGADGHGYILDDMSLKGSPDEWGKQVETAYYLHKADRVIGEENNGGDMVKYVIKSADKNIAYKGIRATRGKYLRAEPVAALYEQGRVHHVGHFHLLEDQLCEWVQGEKSPDRLDANVWCITELMLDDKNMPKVRFI